MRERSIDILYSVVFIFLAIFLFLVSFGDEVAGRSLSRDPVWYPRILLILTICTGIILLVKGILNRSKNTIDTIRWKHLAATMVGAGFYLFLFDLIGFIPDTILLIFCMSWFLGFRKISIIIIVSIAFTVLIWYGFNDLLNVTPPGPELPSIRYSF